MVNWNDLTGIKSRDWDRIKSYRERINLFPIKQCEISCQNLGHVV